MQRRTARAILDAPFCSVNEVVEIDLGFCKLQHLLWKRTLNLRGRLLYNRDSTFDGKLFYMSHDLVYIFESYCRFIMNTVGLSDNDLFNEDGEPELDL